MRLFVFSSAAEIVCAVATSNRVRACSKTVCRKKYITGFAIGPLPAAPYGARGAGRNGRSFRRLRLALYDRLGEQKIDIVVARDERDPFVRMAKRQGVSL
ncbi:hypothetical protein [Endothiovibrio diazotrophicus]